MSPAQASPLEESPQINSGFGPGLRRARALSNPDLLAELEAWPGQRIKVAVTDLDGILRGKFMHKEKFLSSAHSGFGFCNVVFGWDSGDTCYGGPGQEEGYTGWHTGYPDALARIDLSTYRKIPWDEETPFFLADFPDSHPCPRQLLRRVLETAANEGFRPRIGMEFEWFNFKETPESIARKQYRDPETLTPGMFGYSILRSSLNQPFFASIQEQLRRFDVPIEGLHTETGPGVFEAAILNSEALEAADRAVLFKTGVKEIAYRFGILPSFMAKWNAKLPGCSGHTHQSLWDLSESRNLFHDESDPKGNPQGNPQGNPSKMSPLFRSYVAGQLHCLPEILPFFAPTVNSYKRLVDGFWAPTKPSWGIDNRTVACRVIPGSKSSTRLESRVPGSDVNPYLAIAACVASGLYGIRKGLALETPAVTGSAYRDCEAPRLPRNLGEAARRMGDSRLARELFGEAFVDHFTRTRIWEWRQFEDSVSGWEMERYLEII